MLFIWTLYVLRFRGPMCRLLCWASATACGMVRKLGVVFAFAFAFAFAFVLLDALTLVLVLPVTGSISLGDVRSMMVPVAEGLTFVRGGMLEVLFGIEFWLMCTCGFICLSAFCGLWWRWCITCCC